MAFWSRDARWGHRADPRGDRALDPETKRQRALLKDARAFESGFGDEDEFMVSLKVLH